MFTLFKLHSYYHVDWELGSECCTSNRYNQIGISLEEINKTTDLVISLLNRNPIRLKVHVTRLAESSTDFIYH